MVLFYFLEAERFISFFLLLEVGEEIYIDCRSLERDWAELQRKGVASPALEQLYFTKRKELTEQQQQAEMEKRKKEQEQTEPEQRTAEESGKQARARPKLGSTTAESAAEGG